MIWVSLIAAVGVSALLTWLARDIALRLEILDVPNERSSHDEVVPRGGGIAIVVTFLVTLTGLVATGLLSPELFTALVASCLVVAVAGYLDDKYGVPVSVRLVIHVFVAVLFSLLSGALDSLSLGDLVVHSQVVLFILSVLYLIWMLNLFNFMDGIDGIAGTEALTITIAAGVLMLAGHHAEWSYVSLAIGAACAGFLVWNWPPAKIFMGDVGSGFLGFVLAALSIITHNAGVLDIWVWLILMGVFIVDATVTLLARIIRRDKWLSAHRSHAYQKASRKLGAHRPVTIATAVINLVWLWPVAAFASIHPNLAAWLTVLAWTPLVVTAIWLGAGRPD